MQKCGQKGMAVKNWTGIDNYDAAQNISRERKFELLSSWSKLNFQLKGKL